MIDVEKWCKKFSAAKIMIKSDLNYDLANFGRRGFLIIKNDGTIGLFMECVDADERAAALPLLHELMDECFKPEPKYYWRLKNIESPHDTYLNQTQEKIYFSSPLQTNDNKTQFTRTEFNRLITENMRDLFESEEVE